MPRVFAKKRLEFKNRDTGDTAATSILDFCDLPDWAMKDPLYQWAKASGDLEELTEKKAVRKAKELTENEPTE